MLGIQIPTIPQGHCETAHVPLTFLTLTLTLTLTLSLSITIPLTTISRSARLGPQCSAPKGEGRFLCPSPCYLGLGAGRECSHQITPDLLGSNTLVRTLTVTANEQRRSGRHTNYDTQARTVSPSVRCFSPSAAKTQGWRCFAVKERRPVRDLTDCGGTATECDTAQFNSAAGAALTNACGAAHGAAGGAAGVTQPAVTGGTAGGASGATGGGGYDTDGSGGDVAHTAGLEEYEDRPPLLAS